VNDAARSGNRRPRRVLAAWIAVVGALAVIGLGVEDRLTPSTLRVPGTESARGAELLADSFGESVPFAILLRGPADGIDRQGPRLVEALRARGDASVLSPWDRGRGLEQLRPRPGAALVAADIEATLEEADDFVVDDVRAVIDATIRSPVEADLTGYAVVGSALEEASVSATRQAELIAAPVLIIVLLLVFRSPLAALIPLLIGGATVLTARGLLAVGSSWIDIDALAVGVASMMGLALGVDYALLLVSRHREELGSGANPERATAITQATAGRTVIFAGGTLAAAMAVAAVVAPGDLLVSLAASVALVGVVAVVIATSAGPALLLVAGANLDRWMIGGSEGRGRLAAAAGHVLRRPAVVASAVLALLLVLAAPVLALETGPPNVRALPEDDPTRQAFERVEREVSGGWSAPFTVVVVGEGEPVIEPSRLERMQDWQDEIANDDAVQAIVGPGQISRRLDPLRDGAEEMEEARQELASGRRELGRLASGLAEGAAGIEELRDGLSQAARGSSELAAGAARAAGGAARLAAGLSQARAAAAAARDAIGELREGSERLASEARRAASGARELRRGIADARRAARRELAPGAEELAEGLDEGAGELERLREPAQEAEAELERAFDALAEQMTIGRTDPAYPEALGAVARAYGAVTGREPFSGTPVVPGYQGLDRELAQAVARLREATAGAERLARGIRRAARGLERLERGADRLGDGVDELADGADRLAAGIAELEDGSAELGDGLATLAAGARELTAGLDELERGAGELATGLQEGDAGMAELERELGRASIEVRRFEPRLASNERQLRRVQRRTPRLFESGYTFLAALDGARPTERQQARQAIDLDGGGTAARFLVVPAEPPNTEPTDRLHARLSETIAGLAAEHENESAVAGGAAQLTDYERASSERLPLMALALCVVTYLLLVPILRALLLPLIAVALNLLTVGVAFGVLTVLFTLLPGEPLGGPGNINAVTAAGVFGVTFGLSIDYEVFLLARMREGYLRSDDNDEAIRYGIERTGRVITGAAAIMAAVFLAFSTADVSTLRQFGIGLTVAVLLDATVVRLLLLPALMRLGGRATWWIPRWLDRVLPDVDVEPSSRPVAA
jgi:putative drug exporter of the RND superfamily